MRILIALAALLVGAGIAEAGAPRLRLNSNVTVFRTGLGGRAFVFEEPRHNAQFLFVPQRNFAPVVVGRNFAFVEPTPEVILQAQFGRQRTFIFRD